MKKFLLTLLLVVGGLTFSFSQTCTPATDLPDSLIVAPPPFVDTIPGTGIIDTACVNTYFETVIQFQIPDTVETAFGPFPINSVDLATEGAVKNSPASLDYVCNPPNCIFEKDTTGCIVLFGTPTAGEEGEYDLKVQVKIRTPLADLDFLLPDGTLVRGNYFLNVKPEGSANCTTVNTSEYLATQLSLVNVPNPFSNYTEIRVSSLISGDFSFEVYNLLGQQVHRRSLRLFEGANIIPFDGSQLSSGMYQYVLRNQQLGTIGGKMMLSRGN